MTENASSNRVTFESEGDTLVGNLFSPASGDGAPARSAVVVTGSWLTVKEQMAGRYARGLAERGYLALAFDFRGYGESAGKPRDVESPERKIMDIRNAVRFLRGLPEVDRGRVGALGICAGAGYAAVAAADQTRVSSLALVAPWLHDAALVETLYGGAEGVTERIAAGDAAAVRYRDIDVVDYVPAVSTTDPDAAMYGPFDYYLDSGRGAVPQWSNRFALMAWPEWLRFDPIPVAARIAVPTVLVHSEDAAIPDGARRFHQTLAGPKDMHWIGGTQFDFYDQDPTVNAALDMVDKHFQATLGADAG
jgi:fermentation-respiration switch protein FrsA (DUF1100 family)